MLNIFFGSDTIAVRKKAFEHVAPFRDRGADIVEVSGETLEEGILTEALGSVSLFDTPRVVVFDSLKGNGTIFDDILESAKAFVSSPIHFVVVEGALTAAEQKTFEKAGATSLACAKKEQERFNVFALADALVRKDKKSLWILYLQALGEGLSVEEIIGTLFWQIKSMRLAMRTHSPEEAGMKPFVYTKSKNACRFYTPEEVDQLSLRLLRVYHESHRGVQDGDLALERLILTL